MPMRLAARPGRPWRRPLCVAAGLAAGLATSRSAAGPRGAALAAGLVPGAPSRCRPRGSALRATSAAAPAGAPVPPFGDGGYDSEVQAPRVYTHGPCRSEAAKAAVLACGDWAAAPAGGPLRRELAARALATLREHGFVVLEGLLPARDLEGLEAEAMRHVRSPPRGFSGQPLRADRTEVPPPCTSPWTSDWLLKNELVLEVAAKYVRNEMADGRTEEDQRVAWIQWVVEGADIDWFCPAGPVPANLAVPLREGCSTVGAAGERGPWLGQVTLIEAPPFSAPQRRHRDIILPGPCAQLTMQVALTPLNACNGALAFRPASHVLRTPGFEVIATPPPGSVVLYDSFTEHRAIENTTPRHRYALYAEFETRGIFTGYGREHFGDLGAAHLEGFRRAVDPALRRWVAST